MEQRGAFEFCQEVESSRSQAVSAAAAAKVTRYLLEESEVFRCPAQDSHCLINTSIKLVFPNGWKIVLVYIYLSRPLI